MRPGIISISGLKHWISCGEENGERVIIDIYDSKQDADNAAGKAREFFARFGEFCESLPEPHGYDVLHLESN